MPAENAHNVLSVTELNTYIKNIFDNDSKLGNIWIKGEISNFKPHSTGHMYFSLKDSESLIKAVMFRTYASRVNFEVKENMKVLAIGRVSVFPRDGVYQLYVEHMEPFGIGDLYKAYEQLKNKLSALGLFDAQHKKEIPKFPKKIGIITAPDGAAVADMKKFTEYPSHDQRGIPITADVNRTGRLDQRKNQLHPLPGIIFIICRTFAAKERAIEIFRQIIGRINDYQIGKITGQKRSNLKKITA